MVSLKDDNYIDIFKYFKKVIIFIFYFVSGIINYKPFIKLFFVDLMYNIKTVLTESLKQHILKTEKECYGMTLTSYSIYSYAVHASGF